LTLFVAGAAVLFSETQILTGDETRYLMYAVSMWQNGHPLLSLADWQRLYFETTGGHVDSLPAAADNNAPFNSVYLSTVLSPVGYFLGLAGLRLLTLGVGLVGLASLFRICSKSQRTWPALISVGVAALTIPLLPYLHLFYMEVYIFTLLCLAWERLQVEQRSFAYDVVTAVMLLAIPFVHMRGTVGFGSGTRMMAGKTSSRLYGSRCLGWVGLPCLRRSTSASTAA